MANTPHILTEPTLADQITEELAEQIRKGLYPANTRLPTEKDMTIQYGVSRTVIREAISRLKSEGFVETRQGSGTSVKNPRAYESFRLSPDSDPALGVVRIIELRRGIEAEMAALAAERRSALELSQIKKALKAIDNAVKEGGDGVKEDLDFHLAISKATGNPHYTALLGMLTRALEDAIRLTRGNEATAEHLSAQVCLEHKAIAQAIEKKDAQAARAAAFEHMSTTVQRIQNAKSTYWSGASKQTAQRLASTRLDNVLKERTKK